MGKSKKTLITREDVVKRAVSEYEALVAIAKEARRLNAVPGMHLKDGEKAIPKAVEHFVAGRVEYEIDGIPASKKPSAGEAAPRKPRKPRKRGRKAK